MSKPATPPAHPPRRHLVLTGLGVVSLHLALLGSPLTALSRADRTQAEKSLSGTPEPTANGSTIAAKPESTAPDTTSRYSLSLRIHAPVLTLAADPSHLPEPPSEPHQEASIRPEAQTWNIAQATISSEQSLPSSSNEIKALPPTKVPNSARMQFDVLGKIKGFGYTVSGELVWQQDGRQYQSRFEIGMPLLGSRVQTSQGQIGAGGLMPIRFGDKVRSEQAAHFERDKGLISFSANTPSVPLEPGAQDRLSLFMQLASLLAGAPQRYPTGTPITLQTVSAREAEPWVFRVDASETLNLPLGPTTAVRLTRLPRQPYDQQVDLWFAPSLGYLPVRLRVTHPNGDVADQVLRRLDLP
jgi:hypothetical protein